VSGEVADCHCDRICVVALGLEDEDLGIAYRGRRDPDLGFDSFGHDARRGMSLHDHREFGVEKTIAKNMVQRH
jgi:hypothetical protein